MYKALQFLHLSETPTEHFNNLIQDGASGHVTASSILAIPDGGGPDGPHAHSVSPDRPHPWNPVISTLGSPTSIPSGGGTFETSRTSPC